MYNAILFTDQTDNIVSAIPIGAYKCAHVLRKNGYSCLVVNHFSDYTLDELKTLLDCAIGDNTVLLGFSSTFLRNVDFKIDQKMSLPVYPEIPIGVIFPQGKDFENNIINFVKTKNPNIKTIVGGAKSALSYSNQNINYICTGYGETTIVNLMNHLVKGEELKNSSKHIQGRIILDDRYAPEYKFNCEDMKWLDIDVVNYKMLPIEIGRGCIFRCKFCSYPMNGKQNLDFVKDPDLLYQELNSNYENFGIRHYMIVDDTFNDHKEKLESILSVVKRLNFQPIFWAYHRLDLICTRPETLDILYQIGVRGMYFGIETLHHEAGKIIGKGFNRAKQIEMIRHIRNTYPDISMHGSFIIGLPGEDRNSVQSTFDQIVDGTIPLHSWGFYPLVLEDVDSKSFNSEMSVNSEKFGYKKIGKVPGTDLINWKNDYFTCEEAVGLCTKYISISRTLDSFKMPSMTSMQFESMGFDFIKMNDTPWKDVEYHKIETVIRPEFVLNYKEQLLRLIKNV